MTPEEPRRISPEGERYSHPLRTGDGRLMNGRRKLTEDDMAAIRGHFAAGVTAIECARLWGVHRSRIYQIVR